MKAGSGRDAGKPLSLLTILTFASSGVPMAALGLSLTMFLPRYMAGHIGIKLGAIGAAFTIVRLLDIGFDPLLALVMDRIRTPIGRYRPWMIAATPILMTAVYALFMAPKGIHTSYLILWLVILSAGTSMLGLAGAAWAAKLAASYNDRSRMFATMGAVGVSGALLVLLLPILIGGKTVFGLSYVQAMGWFAIIGLPIAVTLVTTRTPEPVGLEVPHQRFGLIEYWRMVTRPDMRRIILVDLCLALGPGTTGALYMFFWHDSRLFSTQDESLLLMWYIIAGFGAPLVGRVALRFGKHRTLIGCTFGYAIAQTSLFLVPKGNFIAAMPGMMACGILAGGFTLLIRAMVADVGDDVRLQTGKERVSLLYAMVTSTQKIGGAITVGVPLMVLDRVGYNAAVGAHNTPQAIHALEMCFVFAPVIFVTLGGVVLMGYKLDANRHAEIRRQLDERDAAMGEAPVLEAMTGAAILPSAMIEP
jgi:GPH family glycoside/pentoside/hexuronide:cation symporter